MEELPALSKSEKVNGQFQNPWPEWKFMKPTELFRFLFFTKDNTNAPTDPAELDTALPMCLTVVADLTSSDHDQVTWIGHASCLVRIAGLNVLTDPVFSEYCAPVQFGLPRMKRFRPPGVTIDGLPRVDAVVISHNHYDHLDYNSIVDLSNKFPEIVWYVPLGLKSWFNLQVSATVHELDWWESFVHSDKLTVSCTPAQHWSKRTPFDTCKTLWGGWCLKSSDKNVYFAGDTGYNPVCFKEIGEKFGPFDLSLIPIGAYEPREFLCPQHVNPDEAVKVHQEVKSALSLGIHWGTFRLGKEHYLAPREDLKTALAKANVDPAEFVTVIHGESIPF